MSANEAVLGRMSVDGAVGRITMPIRVDVDPAEAWSALTESSRLAGWVGEVHGDLRAGGEFRAHFFPSDWEGTGTVLQCDAPRGWLVATSQDGEAATEQIEAAVAVDTRGGCSVTFLHSGMDAAMVAGYAAGLQVHAENLARYLAGEEVVGLDRFRELFALYKDEPVAGKPTNIE